MSHIHPTHHAKTNFGAALYLLVALGIALTGCSNQMEPAKKAITEIEMAVASAGPDAQRYVPEKLKAVNDQLSNLRARFEQKDYAGVISGAPSVLASAQALVAAKDAAMKEASAKEAAEAAARQAADTQKLTTDWQTLSEDLPKQIAALDSRLNVLAKSKNLPANITKDALASAKTDLADAKSSWTAATTAQSGGDTRNAVAAAQQAKQKADAAMASLAMTSG